jgi:transketolase
MAEALPNRVVSGQTLAELGAEDPRIVVLDADVSKGTFTTFFHERFPGRFFNVGVAEQNMMSMAAGLAAAGKIPFACTFAVFASMRACDQVRTSIAYPRLNVKIVASNAGVENMADGVTHQGIEDMAIMRAIPHMMVLSPSDNVITRLATRAVAVHTGPVYMRLGRHAGRIVHQASADFQLGKMIRLREGNDVALIATGNQVEQALDAAEELAACGIQARVLDCHTIKPIDVDEIVRAGRETRGIVTAEDHNIIGGLGSAVCEVLAEHAPSRVRRVGLRDVFASSGREHKKLLSHFHIDAQEIVRQAEQLARGD